MDYPALIRIAADDISQLRRCDVYRVLEWAPAADMNALARWIVQQRPELKAEVIACGSEISSERAGAR